MFCIIGIRPRTTELRMLTMVCWRCRQPGAHIVRRQINHVTLFFIPLIPFGARAELQCLRCGADQRLDDDQAREILALAGPSPRQVQEGGVH